MRNIVIFGASGHGSVVLDIIESAGQYQVVGFIDSYKKAGTKLNGYEVLGSEKQLPFLIEKFNIGGGVVAIGDNWVRRQVVQRIQKICPEFTFYSAIHPKATIGKDVKIGAGTVVMPGSIINANSYVGKHCIVNTLSSLGHDGNMGHYSSLAPRVSTGGNVSIGTCSAVSIGSVVLEGVEIRSYSVVGAGALVIDNVPDHVLVYGSPARVIRLRKADEPYLSGSRDSSVRMVPSL